MCNITDIIFWKKKEIFIKKINSKIQLGCYLSVVSIEVKPQTLTPIALACRSSQIQTSNWQS